MGSCQCGPTEDLELMLQWLRFPCGRSDIGSFSWMVVRQQACDSPERGTVVAGFHWAVNMLSMPCYNCKHLLFSSASWFGNVRLRGPSRPQ